MRTGTRGVVVPSWFILTLLWLFVFLVANPPQMAEALRKMLIQSKKVQPKPSFLEITIAGDMAVFGNHTF